MCLNPQKLAEFLVQKVGFLLFETSLHTQLFDVQVLARLFHCLEKKGLVFFDSAANLCEKCQALAQAAK